MLISENAKNKNYLKNRKLNIHQKTKAHRLKKSKILQT
jgi:hypothetical protein